ncbi:MAG: hypothetical protein ACRDH2_00240, partial [Anaerolineales bacterium]
LGDRDYIWGVAPVHLFMLTLGVRILGPRRVYLEGRNPFPWPVTVRHKGVTVVKDLGSATVIFPSGQQITITDPGPQYVEDE